MTYKIVVDEETAQNVIQVSSQDTKEILVEPLAQGMAKYLVIAGNQSYVKKLALCLISYFVMDDEKFREQAHYLSRKYENDVDNG